MPETSARARGVRDGAVLDADDRILPESLSFLRGLLKHGPTRWRRSAARSSGRRNRPAARPQLAAFVDAGAEQPPAAVRDGHVSTGVLPRQRRADQDRAARDAGGYSDANHGEDWGLAVSLAMRGRIRIATQPTYECRIQRSITTLFPEMGVKAAYDHGSPNPARDRAATPPPRDRFAPDRPWAGSPQRTAGTLSTKRSDRADEHRGDRRPGLSLRGAHLPHAHQMPRRCAEARRVQRRYMQPLGWRRRRRSGQAR
jgi:hypothetical protein